MSTLSWKKDIQVEGGQDRNRGHVPRESSLFHLLDESSTWVLHYKETLESFFVLVSTALRPLDSPDVSPSSRTYSSSRASMVSHTCGTQRCHFHLLCKPSHIDPTTHRFLLLPSCKRVQPLEETAMTCSRSWPYLLGLKPPYESPVPINEKIIRCISIYCFCSIPRLQVQLHKYEKRRLQS